MMIRNWLMAGVFLLGCAAGWAQRCDAVYSAADSALVESLLREARVKVPAAQGGADDVLFFAKRFLGVPYVAATLEQDDRVERLSMRLDALDCTTYVDAVVCLVQCHRQGKRRFADFMACLRRMRYRDGRVDGYASRNHYYSSTILQGERLGLFHEVGPSDCRATAPFTAVQTLKIDYMTRHAEAYAALKADASLLPRIAQAERELTGRKVCYIPKNLLNQPAKLREAVHDGDILALVTAKDGLDVSHLGFAVWGDDGQLHLLNASSIYHQVVLDRNTLFAYSQKQKSMLGIRVLRLR